MKTQIDSLSCESTPHHSLINNQKGQWKRVRAFTLVELLVVIAVIGILIALLMPAVQMVREAARRVQCSNNMRQAGIALHLYHDSNKRFPPGWSGDSPEGEPGWAWQAMILPYIEKSNMADSINFNIPVDDEVHHDVRQAVIPIYLCPSDGEPAVVDISFIEDDGHSHFRGPLLPVDEDDHDHEHDEHVMVSRCNYSGVFGSNEIHVDPRRGNGTFYFNSRTAFKSFRDGTSTTIIVGERRSDRGAVTWVGIVPGIDEPMARIVGSADHPPNHRDGHFEDFRSHHPTGANFVSGDASVRMIHNQIDAETFQALATLNGGEVAFYDEN